MPLLWGTQDEGVLAGCEVVWSSPVPLWNSTAYVRLRGKLRR